MSELNQSEDSLFENESINKRESDLVSHQSYYGSNTFYKYSNYHQDEEMQENICKKCFNSIFMIKITRKLLLM